ncbi:velvet factor-domain-containing protein [Biscogniauxia mediterranea]|nr:velvet factor-domain-containing protein [Biscogniauxia mediterranea]
MVDIMARPLNSWAHEPYAPRHTPYYPQEQQNNAVRLPPPSSLDTRPHPVPAAVPNLREPAAYGHHPHRDPYQVAPLPIQRSPPLPMSATESSHAAMSSSQARRPLSVHGHPSPIPFPMAPGEPPEDLPDHHRFPKFGGDQTSRLHPQLRQMEEAPPHHRYADMHPIRPPPPGYHPRDSRLAQSPQHLMSPQQPTWSPRPETRAPERMRISELLSDEPRADTSSSSKAPVRSATSSAAASAYKIKVRQQPVAARSCGFGERDRRVIDPPPIVQVSIEDPNASQSNIRARLHHPFSVMHCTIWNETGDQDCSAMPEDYRQQRRLMGTIVSSPFVGKDEKDEEGCFFCFPDLSCRTPGSFRLKFSLVILDPRSTPGSKIPVCAVAMSDVFTVYNAKDFPGMQASTALTKRLKEQGCLISIKKGNEKNRTRDDSEEEDDDDDENGGGGSSQRRSKRLRKS